MSEYHQARLLDLAHHPWKTKIKVLKVRKLENIPAESDFRSPRSQVLLDKGQAAG